MPASEKPAQAKRQEPLVPPLEELARLSFEDQEQALKERGLVPDSSDDENQNGEPTEHRRVEAREHAVQPPSSTTTTSSLLTADLLAMAPKASRSSMSRRSSGTRSGGDSSTQPKTANVQRANKGKARAPNTPEAEDAPLFDDQTREEMEEAGPADALAREALAKMVEAAMGRSKSEVHPFAPCVRCVKKNAKCTIVAEATIAECLACTKAGAACKWKTPHERLSALTSLRMQQAATQSAIFTFLVSQVFSGVRAQSEPPDSDGDEEMQED